MAAKPDWPAIKTDYFAGQGSLRELAKRHDVSFHTLAKRAKRERWTDEMATLGDAVATQWRQKASEQGAKLAMDAAGLITKSIGLVEKALREIEKRLGSGASSAAELRSLVSALRDTITIGRVSFGLDQASGAQQHMHVHVMSEARASACVVDVEPEPEPPVEPTVTAIAPVLDSASCVASTP